tara:strand:- start:84 stop:485 length:402 start_codon:yes stop_codon:yes gene_type:complete
MSSENELPEHIKNDFNIFWNSYGKDINNVTKNAKKELGAGVMIADVGMIQDKLNKLDNLKNLNKESDENKNESGEIYYVTLDSLPDYIKSVPSFMEKIENSQNNNLYYILLVKNIYTILISNEDIISNSLILQ